MGPGLSKAARALVLLPLALALQAQRAPEDCRAWTDERNQIEPVLLLATFELHHTLVQNGAVIAEEVMQIAREGWMLEDELRLGEEGLAFPSGTSVDRDHPTDEPRCLPIAPPAGAAAESRRFYTNGRLACLADADGDGRFEQVRMYSTNYAAHVPRARLYRTIDLSTPIALAPDPLGDPGSRSQVTRRLTIGWVDGDTARFRIGHRFGRRPETMDRGRWDRRADGLDVYRLPPALPVPLAWNGQDESANSLTGELVRLVDGQTIEVGGLSLVAYRASPSFPGMWYVHATTQRFPRWLHFGCGGRSVRAGTDFD